MKEDEDEEKLKMIFEGLAETLGRINIGVDEAARRGERKRRETEEETRRERRLIIGERNGMFLSIRGNCQNSSFTSLLS